MELGVGLEVTYNVYGGGHEIPFGAYGALCQLEFVRGDFRIALGAQASAVLGLETALSLRIADEGVVPGFQIGPFLSALYGHGGFRAIFEPGHTTRRPRAGGVIGLKAPLSFDGYQLGFIGPGL